MSIVGIESDKVKKNIKKQEIVAKIREIQFLRSIPLWDEKISDSQDNYIMLKVLDCGGNVELVMWNTTARQEKLSNDVVLVKTEYTDIDMDRSRLLRKAKLCNVFRDFALGGMYNLNKYGEFERVDSADEIARAKVLADIVHKYDSSIGNTDVENQILKEVDNQVYDLVSSQVVRKAQVGGMAYYNIVLEELGKDKKLDTRELVRKWDAWDKNISMASKESVSR